MVKTVKKNMLEIRQLDAHCQKLNHDAQIKVRQLISSWKNISKDARKKSFEALKGDFAKMKDLCDNKIRLSAQTYELVDKYIIRLDNDTAKFNSSVRKKLVDTQVTIDQEPESRKRKNTLTRKDNKKARDKKLDRVDGGDQQDIQSFASPAPLVDMPVDPNEPTYCICHQVSFGQMVMCDNKNCAIEWFHFQCVGLTTKPKAGGIVRGAPSSAEKRCLLTNRLTALCLICY
uniref:Inhibitor of growth protein n=1 Tax=Ditylenchus dipsaci TaxID=166011 RepID=A0A915DI52_9BILA